MTGLRIYVPAANPITEFRLLPTCDDGNLRDGARSGSPGIERRDGDDPRVLRENMDAGDGRESGLDRRLAEAAMAYAIVLERAGAVDRPGG